MKRLTKRTGSTIVSSIAILTASISAAPTTALGQSKPSNVTVINPASNPVNTQITNTVVPVEISNADAIPVVTPDLEGTRETFFKRIFVQMQSSTVKCNDTELLVVPAGKRMVIQYVSTLSNLFTPAELLAVRLSNPDTLDFQLVVPATGRAVEISPGISSVSAAQAMHVYSDVTLSACVHISAASNSIVGVFVLGYFVDKR